jgi:hypothetical protein
MPKEIVVSKYDGDVVKLQIGWTRDKEHVEISTVMPDDKVLQPTPEGNGWFVQLDRAGINRAIRLLRQARDQAFGRDE